MFLINQSIAMNRFLMGLSLATILSGGAHAGSQCRSDIDGNGVVNRGDLQLVLDNWGTANSLANVNGDDVVNGEDLGFVLSEWGSFCGLPSCPADLNRDFYVDGADIDALLASWTAQGSQGNQPSSADLNVDGFVDGIDLGMALAAFGPCDFNNCSQRAMLSDPKSSERFARLTFGALKPPKLATKGDNPSPEIPGLKTAGKN